MIRVARYSSEVIAEAAAAYLRENNITVSVVGHMLMEAHGPRSVVRALDLLVHPAHRGRAESLIDEFHRSPAIPEEGWEDRSAAPDLSLLDPSIELDCPNCGASLPREATLDECPACAAGIDPVAMIVERHGPEALEPCYECAEPPLTAIWARGFCPACAQPIAEESRRGRCAACGTLYDLDQR